MGKRQPVSPPIIPGYSAIRLIGTGGFADVFLFEQDSPKRSVAIKVLTGDAIDRHVLRLFNAEADVMAKLSAHPSIVTVYEANVSSDGMPYLVMEYCPTRLVTLYRSQILSVGESLRISIKIASAVETAHRAGILHRDIKPSNVLFTTFGAPVLSDFGIATALNGTSQDLFAMSVPWSAPEVIAEHTTGTIATEVWAIGATTYTLLASHSPFEIPGANNTRDDLKPRIKRGKYTPIDRADVPEALQRILATAMAVNPVNRFPSALAFAQALQRVELELGLPVTPLDVADATVAAAGPQIDFDNDQLRGPQRSIVPMQSARQRQLPGHSQDQLLQPLESGVDDEVVVRSARKRTVAPWVWGIAGAVLGIAAVLVAVALMGGTQ